MRIALCVSALFLATQAQALGNVTGHVTDVRVDSSGAGMVFFDQPIGGSTPACGHDSVYGSALAFPANAGGKNILAWALFAKSTNASVTVYGSGVCAVYGDYVEDFSYGQVR